MNVKQELFNKCVEMVDRRYRTIENTIRSHQKSLSAETKSSAGDKHETGRAMLQLEMEKAGQQLIAVQRMKETLAKINPLKNTDVVNLGAVIKTNQGNYFLSVSVGQIRAHNSDYFAISGSSPIGKLMLGKKEEEVLVWNGRKIKIDKIT